MICLPSIAKREGCALLQCAPTSAPAIILPPVPTDTNTNINSIDNENNNDNNFVDDTTTDNNNNNNNDIDIKAMLMALGGCVECPNDTIMNTMMITSCMMGPLYGAMRNNRDWLGAFNDDVFAFVIVV